MSMNIFRLAGDMSHVFSIIVLLLRLRVVKNAAGKNLTDVALLIFQKLDFEILPRFITSR